MDATIDFARSALGCDASSHRFFAAVSLLEIMEAERCDANEVAQPSEGPRSSPLQLLMHSKCFDKLPIEFDACFLHFAIRQQPYERFIVKIDHLNAISPWITKVTAKRRLQFEFVFLSKFLSYFLELLFIANHDPEMPHVSLLKFVDFENGEELMVAQFEERVTLPTTHLFEIENILVKSHRLLNVIHLDRDMIAPVDLHAHMSA
jgi:hypothetical protein